MSSKIDIKSIVKGHYQTLIDDRSKKISTSDVITFFILPALASAVAISLKYNISNEIASILVNFGSIFTALLLSVIMLVYEQESKIKEKLIINSEKEESENKVSGNIEKTLRERQEFLKEIYENISYSVTASMILVILSLVQSVFIDRKIHLACNWYLNLNNYLCIYFISPLLIFITINLILTIMMVIKRMHSLLTTN